MLAIEIISRRFQIDRYQIVLVRRGHAQMFFDFRQCEGRYSRGRYQSQSHYCVSLVNRTSPAELLRPVSAAFLRTSLSLSRGPILVGNRGGGGGGGIVN